MSDIYTVTQLSQACQAFANVDYHQVNVQYVNQARVKFEHVAVKSYLGSGKTAFVKEQVLQTKKPVVVIGHRKTLLKQQAVDFNLNYYEDVKGEKKVKRLAVTLDSLYTTGLPALKGAVVVLDELEQVLKHLTGDTSVKSVRKLVYKALQFLLSNASQVIACDGDLSGVGVGWLSKQLGSQTLTVLENTHQAPSKNITSLPTEASALDKVLDLLRANKNVYVCSSSKKLLDFVQKKVEKELPHVVLKSITSDNSQTSESQEFLANASEESKRYNLLLGSPSLGTGVDITNNHFHATVGLYGAFDHMAATDIGQHLARVRQLQDNSVFLWVSPQQVKGLPLTYKAVAKHVDVGNEPSFYDLNTTTGEFEPRDKELATEYSDLYCKVVSRHNTSVSNLRAEVVKHLTQQGHKVTYDSKARGKEETKQELKAWSKERKDKLVQAILAAPDLHKEQVRALKDKEQLTPEESATVERYYLKEQTLLEPTQELVEWYVNDNGKAKLANYKQTFVLDTQELHKAWDYERSTFKEDRQRLLARRQLRNILLNHAVFKTLLAGGSVTSKTLKDDSLTELLQDNKDALQALLGISYTVENSGANARAMTSILEQLGLDIESKSKVNRVEGKTVKDTTYSVNSQSSERMTTVAKLQHDKLEATRLEQAKLLDIF